MSQAEINFYLAKISADLDRTVDFWLKHSHDTELGGFFNCLTRTGDVFDTTKFVWLQGRQVWTYCQLARATDDVSKKEALLAAAIVAGDFLLAHAKQPDTDKCHFSLTRDGLAVKTQRTVFSETFFALAMIGLAQTTGQEKYKDEAKRMLDTIIHWVMEDGTGTGAVSLPGTPKLASLAHPMILLNLTTEAEKVFGLNSYETQAKWAINQLFKHVQRDGTCVLENITLDGKEFSGSAIGRHQNPGHAIEGAWFIMDWANGRTADKDLIRRAIDSFLLIPFEVGWDKEFGGIFSFLDADGLEPLPLEWSMKLWWAHAEAMIAFLMAFVETGNEIHWQKFKLVADYVYDHTKFTENGSGTSTGKENEPIPTKGCPSRVVSMSHDVY
ncbi:unnamed protein product [Notodromas monacha]|uniref:N-acylglucosamine 2-epimerase n=1 Tax=Notodromas monacha TaxID=399045 RepID=A0A7R9BTJ3_9CRUS|nr:unnamed protein product [Notodromas monacha]CAG0921161.1 unnamed protein product [Notodromas monacha]